MEHPFSSEKTGILFYTSDATPNWVSKTLNKIPQPVLRAYDLVPSPGAPDLKVLWYNPDLPMSTRHLAP